MNNKQSLFFIWATILNQSQKAENILINTKILFERLNLIKSFKEEFSKLTYEKIENAMIKKNVLHRFPKNMSIYLYNAVLNINENYGEPKNIFNGDWNEIKLNISGFLGVGKHKTDIAMIILKEYMENKSEISKDILKSKCTRLPQTIWMEFQILDELGDEKND